MKIYCEKCEGTGKSEWFDETPGFEGYRDCDCSYCLGQGFTEVDVVEVEKILAVWLDCYREANSGTDVVMAFNSWLDSLKEGKV